MAPGYCPHLHFWFCESWGISRFASTRKARRFPAASSPSLGQTVFTGEDIRAGQEAFLTYGLMQYGSVYGHGAYLGPDFTADYLHRLALEMHRAYGGDPAAEERTRRELRENRYDPATDVLTWTDAQAKAFDVLRQHYEAEVLNRQKSGGGGLGPHAIRDPAVSRQVVAFIAWTAWTAAARRPGKPHSYTNNWPPEDLVGNHLTQEAVVWSALSIIALLGGIGLLLTYFGRYSSFLGWHVEENRRVRFRSPSEISLTPAQRATAWYFAVVAALFLVQTLLGGATAHYHAETGGFFGYDLARVLPYNLARTWHLQLGAFLGCRLLSSCGDLSRAGDRGFRAARPAPSQRLRSSRPWSLWSWAVSPARPPATRECSRAARVRSSARKAGSISIWERLWQLLLIVGLVALVRDSVPRAAPNAARSSITPISRTSSSTALFRSPCSTRSACSPSRGRISPSPISGASGWCTSGSKISWSCSPRSWWPTSSCCWESCPQGQRLG